MNLLPTESAQFTNTANAVSRILTSMDNEAVSVFGEDLFKKVRELVICAESAIESVVASLQLIGINHVCVHRDAVLEPFKSLADALSHLATGIESRNSSTVELATMVLQFALMRLWAKTIHLDTYHSLVTAKFVSPVSIN
jgi:hypothetical protein